VTSKALQTDAMIVVGLFFTLFWTAEGCVGTFNEAAVELEAEDSVEVVVEIVVDTVDDLDEIFCEIVCVDVGALECRNSILVLAQMIECLTK